MKRPVQSRQNSSLAIPLSSVAKIGEAGSLAIDPSRAIGDAFPRVAPCFSQQGALRRVAVVRPPKEPFQPDPGRSRHRAPLCHLRSSVPIKQLLAVCAREHVVTIRARTHSSSCVVTESSTPLAALLRLEQHPLRRGGHALLLVLEESLVLLVPQPKLMESQNGEMGEGTVTSGACSLDCLDVPTATGVDCRTHTQAFIVLLVPLVLRFDV
jgi:hypothetical protein